MKTLIGAALLLSVQAFAGGIQGNGIINPQIQAIMLNRAKTEILTKATGNSALANKLQSNNVSIPDLKKASFSGKVDGLASKMGNSTSANRVLVADGLAQAMSLPTALSADIVGAAKAQTASADFMIDADFAQIYKPIARPQAIRIDAAKLTVAGSMCSGYYTNAFVDQKAQVIHIIVSSLVVSDPLSNPLVRGTCMVSVPVLKAIGKGIVFHSVDAHGIVAKQGNSKLQLDLEAFVSGAQDPKPAVLLLPENSSTTAKRFNVSVKSNVAHAVNSSSALLRLNLSVIAQRQTQNAIGIVGLDRISIRYGLR